MTKNMNVSFGLDAPGVVAGMLATGLVAAAAGAVAWYFLYQTHVLLSYAVATLAAIFFLSFFIPGVLMIYSSFVGKQQVINALVDKLGLTGTEQVLDVGCGRGVLAITVAQELKSGSVTGIDIWQTSDQLGNAVDKTLSNAQTAGVADRLRIVTGDMRQMPFDDQSFDVVVSSLAIHNVPTQLERARALQEILRVLKPGGTFALLDFQFIDEYSETLRGLQASHVMVSRKIFSMFPPVCIVTGRKALR